MWLAMIDKLDYSKTSPAGGSQPFKNELPWKLQLAVDANDIVRELRIGFCQRSTAFRQIYLRRQTVIFQIGLQAQAIGKMRRGGDGQWLHRIALAPRRIGRHADSKQLHKHGIDESLRQSCKRCGLKHQAQSVMLADRHNHLLAKWQ